MVIPNIGNTIFYFNQIYKIKILKNELSFHYVNISFVFLYIIVF